MLVISTFFGIEIARRAIQTASEDMDVVGHNVANASTDGYCQEVAQNEATDPYTVPMLNNPDPGQVGTGVEVGEITRSVDQWVNQQVNGSDSTVSYWKSVTDQLEVAQTAFQEPTSIGIQSAMDGFFDAWQTLSENPSDQGARASVVSDASQLIDDLHTSADSLTQTAGNIQTQMQSDVASINSMAEQITTLNQEIASVSAQGEQPNDLEDKRDELISQLAQLAPVSVTADSSNNGTVSVSIYGQQLVASSASVANTVSMTTVADAASAGGYDNVLEVAGGTTVFLSGTSLSASYATAGALTGLEYARQETETYLGQLDTLTYNLVQEVNMQHQEGANGQALASSASTTFASGTFAVSFGGGGSVTVSFSNTVGTNLGLLDSMAQAIDSSTTLQATVVTDPQSGTSYLNVVSSTSVPTSVTLSGAAVDYSGPYTSTYDADGNPGGLFFTPLSTVAGSAANISLSTNISPSTSGANPDLDHIAAAATSTDQRDGDNALAIYNLQDATWTALDGGTFDSYYEATTEKVGADVQTATNLQQTAQTTNTQLVNMQQSVSGVSTDEEMTMLVQFQYAYQAAAEFLMVQNSVLGTLVNQTLTTS